MKILVLAAKTLLLQAAFSFRTSLVAASEDLVLDLTLVIHRNGEPDPCGSARLNKNFQENSNTNNVNKYQMEARLTNAVAEALQDDDVPTTRASARSCGSPDNATAPEGLYGFCDMGVDRTPILLDHDNLVPTKTGSLPCRWYTREGLRITSLEQLQNLVAETPSQSKNTNSCENDEDEACNAMASATAPTEVHLYGVPSGRVFMFAPSYVGEIFELSHLTLQPDPEHVVYMQVLSTNPRVFDIFHVFSKPEADEVVRRALAETSPSHRMHRSTTGTSENAIFTKRTSDNAFDTHGKTALALKKRIFEVLGFDEYWNGHDDGLQVLRYNATKAYVQHMDYLEDKSGQELFDYRSDGKGGNRFATVLLYMTDMPEEGGGETVFSEAYPAEQPVSEHQTMSQAIAALRASGDATAAGVEQGSWEEQMVARCRSRFSVRPSHGRAVLFYSQLPNGEKDPMSKHGGCPVLEGEKWAANLWVWNTPREHHTGAPVREDLIAKGHKPPPSNKPQMISATFTNSGKDPATKNAELWFDEAMFWGKLGHGDPLLRFNTYEGHRWNVRVDGKIFKDYVIGPDEVQRFEV